MAFVWWWYGRIMRRHPGQLLLSTLYRGTLSLSFLSSNAIVSRQGKRDFEDRRSWTQLCLHCTSQELHTRDCYSGTEHWKFCSVQLITLPTSICGPSDVFSSLSYFEAVKQLELDSIHSFQRTKDMMTEAMFSLNTMTEDGNIKENGSSSKVFTLDMLEESHSEASFGHQDYQEAAVVTSHNFTEVEESTMG
ncbi:unnamed protein product [Prunus armeniaca]|uniref:Uncharacterized protein n=1 Tax=Prunus armeniaca TaxID=36596 RepID=A0A6J5TG29_PRUAR|nr:unnamed protein product [Prunus armeniaca]